jgi:hypothetical protein
MIDPASERRAEPIPVERGRFDRAACGVHENPEFQRICEFVEGPILRFVRIPAAK